MSIPIYMKSPLLILATSLLAAAIAGAAHAQSDADEAHQKLLEVEQYPSAFKCEPCHPLQFRQWSASQHSYSNLSPAFTANDNNTRILTNGTSGDTCARCHNPVGAALKVSSETSNMKRRPVAREGVTCIVCHRQNKRYGKISGRMSIARGVLYEPIFGPTNNEIQKETEGVEKLRISTSPDKRGRAIHKRVEGVSTQRDPVFCGPCHGARLPTGLRSEETYDEYRMSKSARDGVTCQACHMGKVPGEDKGFDTGPAATISGHETTPRRISNHYFGGPDFSILHPGIFPHNRDAWELATYEEWLDFDHEAGWGTDEFESGVSSSDEFPEAWDDPDLRAEAREILNDQFELLDWAGKQREAVLKAGYQVEEVVIEEANLDDGIEFKIKLINPIDAHNVPTGFIHERMVFVQVTVTDSHGNAIYRSGDRDPNGDVREQFSRYVRNGELPIDHDLVNLQSHFIVREAFGGERAQVTPVPFSLTTRPFVRPPGNPTSILMHPNGIRVIKHSIAPGGHRWAKYDVDPDELEAGETYTLDMKLIVQPFPGYFLHSISDAGFDYKLSLREIVDRTVATSVVVWERTETVTVESGG